MKIHARVQKHRHLRAARVVSENIHDPVIFGKNSRYDLCFAGFFRILLSAGITGGKAADAEQYGQHKRNDFFHG